MSNLTGKVALVTGGASGIGEATARALADAGAQVTVADVQDEAGTLVAKETGGNYVHLDVTDETQWSSAVEEITAKQGNISVLVNNAGVFLPGGTEHVSVEHFRRSFEVNQLGVFFGIRAVVPSMSQGGGGSIINISSSAGLVGVPDAIAYSSSKWAVRGLTKGAALDLARYGIRVNSVHPGLVDTPIFTGFPQEQIEAMTSVLPFPRLGKPEEIAALVRFLASDESSFSTGSEFIADGGYAVP
ncbi:SDR family oxidoreductase (plasmid) [Rhodococcus rhodochrous]|uniref:SDR family NAD(P)-dependent oxidoreductase n=1 Tax=Rhodococcus rhodochrous TaxID=1829 RepID=UPI00132F43C8|nr:glucose 1-dehydrogenase [Rhodococcus rhodochrous]QHG85530.1 SDR family oxidoreductase [Rhodococcus rhodochrous]